MDDDSKRTSAPPAIRDGTEPAKRSQPDGRERRAVRAVDLTDNDIAAIEAGVIVPGYEYLNMELGEG